MKIKPLTYSIGAGNSMARSKQAVDHILQELPGMIRQCHEQFTENHQTGMGNNDYQWGRIDVLIELQKFLQDAIK